MDIQLIGITNDYDTIVTLFNKYAKNPYGRAFYFDSKDMLYNITELDIIPALNEEQSNYISLMSTDLNDMGDNILVLLELTKDKTKLTNSIVAIVIDSDKVLLYFYTLPGNEFTENTMTNFIQPILKDCYYKNININYSPSLEEIEVKIPYTTREAIKNNDKNKPHLEKVFIRNKNGSTIVSIKLDISLYELIESLNQLTARPSEECFRINDKAYLTFMSTNGVGYKDCVCIGWKEEHTSKFLLDSKNNSHCTIYYNVTEKIYDIFTEGEQYDH